MASDFDVLADKWQASAESRQYYHDPVGFLERYIDWPAGSSLASYQEDVATKLVEKRRVAVRGPHGLGKALCLSMHISTPMGWTTMGDIQVGDEVFDERGRPCRVTGKSEVFAGPTYEVEFADGSTLVTHGEHEWNAVDVYDRPRAVRDWREHWIATKTVTTAHMAQRLRTRGGQLRWRIPTAKPLELPEANLPIDPYVLGLWLADGSSAGGFITLNRDDADELVAQTKRSYMSHFIPSGERRGSRGLRVHDLHARLRLAGLLGDKHIPQTYLRASEWQRRRLVQGLFDGDGYMQRSGGRDGRPRVVSADEVTLTNKRLVDGVVELLHSLGLQVRVREGRAKLEGRDVGPKWRISARFDECPYALSRYRDEWVPRGGQASRHTQRTVVDIRRIEDRPTQCIEVDSPSHLYLAGEAMIPTHNSSTAALVVIWFALTREIAGVDWKVPTTATAWRHLTLYLWPEIHKWLRRVKWAGLGLPEPQKRTELLDMRLKLTHGAASAIASDDPVTLEGAHADSILFVYDESKAIPNATWDATEGALSGVGDEQESEDREGQPLEAYALAISTPGAPAGRFYDIHARKPGLEDWHPIHVTLEDAIRAKRISRKWAEQRKLLWGEDSAIYRNRVLGEFHSADEDAVIPLGWIEAANDRYEEWQRNGSPQEGRKVVSTDVARTGSDFTVITDRHDRVLAKVHKHRFADTMRTATEVIKHLDDTATAIIDSIGIGAGVLDRLRELKLKVRAYTGSKKTHHMDRTKEFGFTNTRSAAYWNLRELLDPAFGAEIALPPDDGLTGDLTSPKYTYTTGVPPKIKVEPKEDLAKRIGRSPDVGDAVVMSFWLDREHGESTVVVPGQQHPQANVSTDGQQNDEDKNGTDLREHKATTPPPVTRTPNVSKRRSKRITRISPLDSVRNPMSRIGR